MNTYKNCIKVLIRYKILLLHLKDKLLKILVIKHIANGYNREINQEVKVDLTSSIWVFSKIAQKQRM